MTDRKKLKDVRQAMGLSREKAARRIGVTSQTVYACEKGISSKNARAYVLALLGSFLLDETQIPDSVIAIMKGDAS